MDGFLRYKFTGLIFGRAYTWRALFSELYGNLLLSTLHHVDDCTRDSCIVLHHLHCTHKILCIMYLSRP